MSGGSPPLATCAPSPRRANPARRPGSFPHSAPAAPTARARLGRSTSAAIARPRPPRRSSRRAADARPPGRTIPSTGSCSQPSRPRTFVRRPFSQPLRATTPKGRSAALSPPPPRRRPLNGLAVGAQMNGSVCCTTEGVSQPSSEGSATPSDSSSVLGSDRRTRRPYSESVDDCPRSPHDLPGRVRRGGAVVLVLRRQVG